MVEITPLRLTSKRRAQHEQIRDIKKRLKQLPVELRLVFEEDLLTAMESRLVVLEKEAEKLG